MKNLKVRDLMTEDVVTVTARSSLADLYDLMDARHIRHVPVVDEEGTLVGIVTHRDLVRGFSRDTSQLPLSAQRDVLRATPVKEVMSLDPETVEPDSPLRDAGDLLLEHKLGCVPVVEGERLAGILTESDFVRYVVESS